MRTRLGALLLAALLAGCGSTPPTRYYLLEATLAAEPAAGGPSLGISRLEVAEYLLAPQLQSREGPHALSRAGFAAWAEPLDEGIARVLALDLAAALDTQAVRGAPWPRDWVPRWELRVRIERLDARADAAELVAAWSLQDGARERPAADRLARIVLPRSGEGDAAVAADLSALLAEFARRVAAEIRAASAGDAAPPPD